MAFIRRCGLLALVQQYLAITCLVDEMRMTAGDDGGGCVASGLAGHLDVKLLGDVFFQFDADVVRVGNKLFALLQSLRCEIFDDLQLIFAFADDGTERNGNGQAYHPRTGNAHPHGVFQHVGTQPYLYLLRPLL